MTPKFKKSYYRYSLLVLFCISALSLFARVGGAGGHSHSGGGSGGSGSGGGGGGFLLWYLLFNHPILSLIIIAIVVYFRFFKNQGGGSSQNNTQPPAPVSFPAGLDENKVGGSFMAIQDAWQRKDLKSVRKWLSDGMYQRLTCQFRMMALLDQKNILTNIRIHNITAAGTDVDGHYQTAEVAISFSMNDSFTSGKYPQFNENYPGDTDMEYWTFIKRTDSTHEKNLYDNANCPNCGAPFETKMGEISRCNYCKTLTNSAAYDWVLSEITQQDDYTGGAGLSDDTELRELMKNDPFFATQRMEDIASNVFMQVMQVLTGTDTKRLTRFADAATTGAIIQQKGQQQPFVFDRLFLNSVTLTGYNLEGDVVNLFFQLTATYRRVAVGDKLKMLDSDFVTSPCSMELTRCKDVTAKPGTGETVYSYECSSCGAPYTDTTDDRCTYCNELVVDQKKNWVLTNFEWRQ